jgi:LmbE family N-acetylglucosaminyl deacetylase
MRKAADEGHRVVLVVATRGEYGEVDDGYLIDGEPLWRRRVTETLASAAILGVQRTEFLGYVDSGMMGAPTNDLPGSFWTAPIEEAAGRLATILRQETADVLTSYDDNGNYGHPDHIQVNRVGRRAAELAGTPRVYQLTMNRDVLRRGMTEYLDRARAAGLKVPGDDDSTEPVGKPESKITAAVDVSAYVDVKKAAMRAHASQIGDQSAFLSMPDDLFREVFGTEWAIREGQGPGITETDLLAGL